MATRPFPSYWIYRDTKKEWRWTYHGDNAKAIAVSSESYKRKRDCQRGIDIMKASSNSPVWGPTEDIKAED